MQVELPDPRVFAQKTDAPRLPVIDRVESSLAATSAEVAATEDREIDREIASALDTSGAALAALFDAAASPAAYRHLWRRLTQVMSIPASHTGECLAVTLFAIPLVIVAGCESADASTQLPGTIDNAAAIADILCTHAALGGNRNFALAQVLVSASAIDIAELPRLRMASIDVFADGVAPLPLIPAPMAVTSGESVYLRFLLGSALSAPGAQLFSDVQPGQWAIPMAKVLASALAADGATVLALPRAPASLPHALASGKVAQREVSAQLFITNALRKMRASIGEPTAIISAHRLDDGGGELRLSLSSPFSPRDAEGFRCPLFAFERVGDAAAMLDDLLRDCRVTDLRVQPGIHSDRDRETGLTLLFKPPDPATGLPRGLN